MENPVVREEEEEEKEEVADERDRVQREWPATWSGECVSEQQLGMYVSLVALEVYHPVVETTLPVKNLLETHQYTT